MKYLWVSPEECTKQELYQLLDLLKVHRDLRLVISTKPPILGNRTDGEKSVDELLAGIGIGSRLKGWRYVKEAIELGLEDRGMLESITKCMYPAIAEKFSSSTDQVEHAIRRAIEVSWTKGDEWSLEKIFRNYSRGNKRPTNAEFICRVVDYIKTRC